MLPTLCIIILLIVTIELKVNVKLYGGLPCGYCHHKVLTLLSIIFEINISAPLFFVIELLPITFLTLILLLDRIGDVFGG